MTSRNGLTERAAKPIRRALLATISRMRQERLLAVIEKEDQTGLLTASRGSAALALTATGRRKGPF